MSKEIIIKAGNLEVEARLNDSPTAKLIIEGLANMYTYEVPIEKKHGVSLPSQRRTSVWSSVRPEAPTDARRKE